MNFNCKFEISRIYSINKKEEKKKNLQFKNRKYKNSKIALF